VRYLASEWCDL